MMENEKEKTWKLCFAEAMKMLLTVNNEQHLCEGMEKSYKKISKIAQRCIKKKMAKRCNKLKALLKRYIFACYMARKGCSSTANCAYEEFMSRYLSIVIKISLLESNFDEECQYALILYFLDFNLKHSPEHMLDAVLRTVDSFQSNSQTYSGIFWKVWNSSQKQIDSSTYLKCLLLVKCWTRNLEKTERRQYIISAKSIPITDVSRKWINAQLKLCNLPKITDKSKMTKELLKVLKPNVRQQLLKVLYGKAAFDTEDTCTINTESEVQNDILNEDAEIVARPMWFEDKCGSESKKGLINEIEKNGTFDSENEEMQSMIPKEGEILIDRKGSRNTKVSPRKSSPVKSLARRSLTKDKHGDISMDSEDETNVNEENDCNMQPLNEVQDNVNSVCEVNDDDTDEGDNSSGEKSEAEVDAEIENSTDDEISIESLKNKPERETNESLQVKISAINEETDEKESPDENDELEHSDVEESSNENMELIESDVEESPNKNMKLVLSDDDESKETIKYEQDVDEEPVKENSDQEEVEKNEELIRKTTVTESESSNDYFDAVDDANSNVEINESVIKPTKELAPSIEDTSENEQITTSIVTRNLKRRLLNSKLSSIEELSTPLSTPLLTPKRRSTRKVQREVTTEDELEKSPKLAKVFLDNLVLEVIEESPKVKNTPRNRSTRVKKVEEKKRAGSVSPVNLRSSQRLRDRVARTVATTRIKPIDQSGKSNKKVPRLPPIGTIYLRTVTKESDNVKNDHNSNVVVSLNSCDCCVDYNKSADYSLQNSDSNESSTDSSDCSIASNFSSVSSRNSCLESLCTPVSVRCERISWLPNLVKECSPESDCTVLETPKRQQQISFFTPKRKSSTSTKISSRSKSPGCRKYSSLFEDNLPRSCKTENA